MRLFAVVLALVVVIPLGAGELVAQEKELPSAAELKAVLAEPIITDTTTQREVEAFCEARVLKFPVADAPERASAAAWQKYIAGVRENVFQNVVFRGAAADWRNYSGKIEWQDTIEGGEGYSIRKLRFEAVPGMWVPAVVYVPSKSSGKMPVFLNVNGHDGAGKAAKYKQIRCINMAKRGLLVMNLEWMGMGQLRTPGFTHTKINQLDLCGTSGVATHYLAMKRGLDILLSQENVDATRVGVAGLSGGGWQTIFFTSLDARVTLSNPVAGYSSFLTRIQHYSDLGDSEQTPVDLAANGDYAHLTAMLAPRVALLTFNEKDNCCFAAPHALPPLMEASRPVYQLLGKPTNLHSHINYDPGNHNFERDNREALYKVIGEHWFTGDNTYLATEIECDAEVKKSDDLQVEMPADNLDLQQLALQLAKSLPRGQATREQVAKTLHLPPAKLSQIAATSPAVTVGNVIVQRYTLKVNDAWTVPAVLLRTQELAATKGTTIVLADTGRADAAEQVRAALADGWSVLAVDPFYFGEAKVKNKNWLFAILVSSVGERPLGVQVAQLQAAASFLKNELKVKQVRVAAFGPRTSLIALAAAATEEKNIDGLQLTGSLGSLKEVIENGGQADKTPEQFCFGLLETADIAQLATLVAPRPVRFAGPSERVKQELAGLAAVYQQLGSNFDPLSPEK
ncbi:alpha/beta hydrolase family protein [Anatilimnocola sp. NA78]|uniref:alpha/beta hydrolase family protein n=1 Tax=Anatilimnocola sp. NA78 TaxID=3415683 RepID=UPI003CE4FADE